MLWYVKLKDSVCRWWDRKKDGLLKSLDLRLRVITSHGHLHDEGTDQAGNRWYSVTFKAWWGRVQHHSCACSDHDYDVYVFGVHVYTSIHGYRSVLPR